jgi:RNA polymerase sigma-70 factor (ECF subfamily)
MRPDVARATVGEVYEQNFDYLWRTLRRLGVPDADLEDAAHDVFIVVQRRLDDYDSARPLRPWLFGIALRIVSERRRRRATQPWELPAGKTQVAAVPDQSPSPEASLAAEQARAAVHRALESVPLLQRAVVIMHDLDGYSAPEVAEALGAGLSTVYSRLRLGREKFVQALEAAAKGEP